MRFLCGKCNPAKNQFVLKLALVEVLESGVWSYNGPKGAKFLKLWQEYSDAGHVLLAANSTVTLQLALEALDVGFGDEVIVPWFDLASHSRCGAGRQRRSRPGGRG